MLRSVHLSHVLLYSIVFAFNLSLAHLSLSPAQQILGRGHDHGCLRNQFLVRLLLLIVSLSLLDLTHARLKSILLVKVCLRRKYIFVREVRWDQFLVLLLFFHVFQLHLQGLYS